MIIKKKHLFLFILLLQFFAAAFYIYLKTGTSLINIRFDSNEWQGNALIVFLVFGCVFEMILAEHKLLGFILLSLQMLPMTYFFVSTTYLIFPLLCYIWYMSLERKHQKVCDILMYLSLLFSLAAGVFISICQRFNALFDCEAGFRVGILAAVAAFLIGAGIVLALYRFKGSFHQMVKTKDSTALLMMNTFLVAEAIFFAVSLAKNALKEMTLISAVLWLGLLIAFFVYQKRLKA